MNGVVGMRGAHGWRPDALSADLSDFLGKTYNHTRRNMVRAIRDVSGLRIEAGGLGRVRCAVRGDGAVTVGNWVLEGSWVFICAMYVEGNAGTVTTGTTTGHAPGENRPTAGGSSRPGRYPHRGTGIVVLPAIGRLPRAVSPGGPVVQARRVPG